MPKIEAQDCLTVMLASVLAVMIGLTIRMAYELGRMDGLVVHVTESKGSVSDRSSANNDGG